jgi:hypothetical protein
MPTVVGPTVRDAGIVTRLQYTFLALARPPAGRGRRLSRRRASASAICCVELLSKILFWRHQAQDLRRFARRPI